MYLSGVAFNQGGKCHEIWMDMDPEIPTCVLGFAGISRDFHRRSLNVREVQRRGDVVELDFLVIHRGIIPFARIVLDVRLDGSPQSHSGVHNRAGSDFGLWDFTDIPLSGAGSVKLPDYQR